MPVFRLPPVFVLLIVLFLLFAPAAASQTGGCDDRVSQLAAQVRGLSAQVEELQSQLHTLLLENAAARVARLEQELSKLAAARRELEGRETARAVELAEMEQHIAEGAPQGAQRDLAETIKLELAVTRPLELAQEQAALQAREAELRARLALERRAWAALRERAKGQARASKEN